MKNTAIRTFFAVFLSVCILNGCFTVFAHAGTGSSEAKFILLSHAARENGKYVVISKTELYDYAESGGFTVCAVNGKFDSRGETYQAFIACYASSVEYVDGKEKPSEMTPTADGLYAEAMDKFDNNEITGNEFQAAADEYGYCKVHEASIKRCAERAANLKTLDTPRYEIKFVYDKTLNELLKGDFSFILVIVLTVCFSAVFSREHESGAYDIIRKVRERPLFADISAFMSANAVMLSGEKSAGNFVVIPLLSVLLIAFAASRFTNGGKGRARRG